MDLISTGTSEVVVYGHLYIVTMISSETTPETSTESAPSGRTFPPLYSSAGDASMDRLAFFHILERLKVSFMALSVRYN